MDSYSPFEDYLGLSKLLQNQNEVLDDLETPPSSYSENGTTTGRFSAPDSWDRIQCRMVNSFNGFSAGLQMNSLPAAADFLSMECSRTGDDCFRSDYSSVHYEDDDHRSQSDVTGDHTSGEDDVFQANNSRCSSMSEYSWDNIGRISTSSVQRKDDGSSPRGSMASVPPARSGVDRLAKLMEEMNQQVTDNITDEPARGCFLEFRPTCMTRLVKRDMFCVLCKRNGETKEFYTTHVLKDTHGKVICPILRKYVCPRCLATGDTAHTLRHCPFADQGLGSMSRTFLTRRSSCGVRRKDN